MSIKEVKVSFYILFLLVSLSSIESVSQSLGREQKLELFAALADDEKAVAECQKITDANQMKEFGRKLPKVSGHCWSGCPTSIPKPHYPENARRNGTKGEVIVNAIVDQDGKVIFAEAAKGNRFLRRFAIEAAYKATYQPKITCGNRRIKFRWRIRYYFNPAD